MNIIHADKTVKIVNKSDWNKWIYKSSVMKAILGAYTPYTQCKVHSIYLYLFARIWNYGVRAIKTRTRCCILEPFTKRLFLIYEYIIKYINTDDVVYLLDICKLNCECNFYPLVFFWCVCVWASGGCVFRQ